MRIGITLWGGEAFPRLVARGPWVVWNDQRRGTQAVVDLVSTTFWDGGEFVDLERLRMRRRRKLFFLSGFRGDGDDHFGSHVLIQDGGHGHAGCSEICYDGLQDIE